MPHIKIATVFNIELEFVVAGLPGRIMAYLIDLMVLILYLMLAKYALYGDGYARSSSIGVDILVISTPMLLYSLVCEVLWHGQSVGKKLLNLRVISLNGKEPTINQYFIRWIFRIFEWPFFFGYIFFSDQMLVAYSIVTLFLGLGVVIVIAVTPKNQRLGDLAANTVVIRSKTDYSVRDTLFVDIADEDYQVTFPDVLKMSDRDINTILKVLKNYSNQGNNGYCKNMAEKIQELLKIQTDMKPIPFLKTLIKDYNYLSNK